MTAEELDLLTKQTFGPGAYYQERPYKPGTGTFLVCHTCEEYEIHMVVTASDQELLVGRQELADIISSGLATQWQQRELADMRGEGRSS